MRTQKVYVAFTVKEILYKKESERGRRWDVPWYNIVSTVK